MSEPKVQPTQGYFFSDWIEAQIYVLNFDILDDYRDAFALFDQNGDGTISIDELAKVMDNLGNPMTKDEIQQMIMRVDLNSDGTIDYAEFLKLMEMPMSEADSEKELAAAFGVFDKDGSGLISPVELKQTMRQLGFPLKDEEIEVMMREADENHDGQISFKEFKMMMESSL